MKRAFTLIELLVVIAIIAILAAILFPVFAQAKEAAKKTTALSNAKQQGLAVNMYLGDNEDSFPFAYSGRADGSWRFNTLHPVPVDAVAGGGWDTPAGRDASGQVWANSLQPYMKSYGLMELPGKGAKGLAETFVKAPALMGLTYNGYFHSLNASMVASPSVAVAFWAGNGDTNIRGRSAPNPVLNCTAAGPCRFTPGGHPQGGTGDASIEYGGWDGTESLWVYGKSMPTVRTDGSAKNINPGTQVDPAFTSDPWGTPAASVTAKGSLSGYWTQCAPGNPAPVATPASAQYWCFFRPDRTE